jgi:arginase
MLFNQVRALYDRLPTWAVHDLSERPADVPRSAFARHVEVLGHLYEKVATSTAEAVAAGHTPVVLSGDHGNALGVMAGLKRHLGSRKLGVVWIDAHGDLHSPYTTPSGNMHGMPLGAALGHNFLFLPTNTVDAQAEDFWQTLKQLGGTAEPIVRPEHLVFVGIRSLEQAEWSLIEDRKIRHFTVEDVTMNGAVAIGQEVLRYLDTCDAIYVSFDTDSFDALLAPGTGTPVPLGLSYTQALLLTQTLWQSPKLAAFELTEVNPLLDRDGQTARLGANLLAALLKD